MTTLLKPLDKPRLGAFLVTKDGNLGNVISWGYYNDDMYSVMTLLPETKRIPNVMNYLMATVWINSGSVDRVDVAANIADAGDVWKDQYGMGT